MATEWRYKKGSQQFGPVSVTELKSLARSGQLTPKDLVRTDGMTDWKPAGAVQGLFSPPPQPPPIGPQAQPPTTPAAKRAPAPSSANQPSPIASVANRTVGEVGFLGISEDDARTVIRKHVRGRKPSHSLKLFAIGGGIIAVFILLIAVRLLGRTERSIAVESASAIDSPNAPVASAPPEKAVTALPPTTSVEAGPPESTLTVTASKLCAAYKSNEAAADAMYKGKWLTVSGISWSGLWSSDSFPNCTLMIPAGNAKKDNYIACYVNKGVIWKMTSIDTVPLPSVTGKCIGADHAVDKQNRRLMAVKLSACRMPGIIVESVPRTAKAASSPNKMPYQTGYDDGESIAKAHVGQYLRLYPPEEMRKITDPKMKRYWDMQIEQYEQKVFLDTLNNYEGMYATALNIGVAAESAQAQEIKGRFEGYRNTIQKRLGQ